MRSALLLVLVLLLGGGGVVGVVALSPGCASSADPCQDEANEVNALFSARYDEEQRRPISAAQKKALYAAWRKERALELIAVYQRHGREVPSHLVEQAK